MKLVIATAAACMALSTAVSAQTGEFKCPAKGTELTYRTAGTNSVRVATGQDGTVCLSKSTSAGENKEVRTHYGLIGSVDAQGESYVKGIDLKSLWPLKVGNKTVQTVNVTGRDGKSYTSNVTMMVAAYEKVTVPAGTFDAFRVEESKANDPSPHIHWWAPALGVSVKESFPDWRDRSKLMVYELAAVKPAAKP